MEYPADPPRAEEIILVMRQAGQDRHGMRIVGARHGVGDHRAQTERDAHHR